MTTDANEEMRKERFDAANKFSEAVVKKFGNLIKSVITWGSLTRKEHVFTEKSDIDCVILIDDTAMRITNKIRQSIDNDVRKIAKETDKRISVQPVWLLTEFWDMLRSQSPLVYSILREGWALYDTGFFVPTRKLYELGRFPATSQAAYMKLEDVPRRLQKAETMKAMIVFEDLFYAMVESAQAVIMFIGREPPGVRGSPNAIRKYFIDEGLLEERYAKDLEDMVKFHKAVEYGEIKTVSGKELDEWLEKTRKFVERFEKLLKYLENRKKTEEIKQLSELMLKTSTSALKVIDKLPKDPKKLNEAFEKHLVEPGLVNPAYTGLLEKVLDLKKSVDQNKLEDISENDLYSSREYVRRFMFDVKHLFREKKFLSKERN